MCIKLVLLGFKFVLLDVDECIVICMINWTENKTTMMMTPLIIPEPTIDPDPGQCLAPHILPGAEKKKKRRKKDGYLCSINFKLLRQMQGNSINSCE